MPLDEQLLPNPALKPWYDRVVWLFVSRNFKEDDKDREALRTHERFGISSWPQMIVFDPVDDRVLLDPPRDLRGFVRAFEQAVAHTEGRAPGAGVTAAHRALRDVGRPDAGDDRSPAARLDDPNPIVRAVALEELAALDPLPRGALAEAEAILGRQDEDVVVYLRALRLCAKRRPEAALSRAANLLAVANDPLRYEVLELLAARPQPALAAILNRLFAQAGAEVPSRNPNVLRMRTAPCLGACGDAQSIDAMAPLARAADWRNGTTRVVLAALAALGARLPSERTRVDALLCQCLPPAVAAEDTAGSRASVQLAGRVVAALAELRPGWRAPALPAQWDAAARSALLGELARPAK
ncbi:MAG: hypothetical protein R3F56_09530 [Planctomycetota bacterium]